MLAAHFAAALAASRLTPSRRSRPAPSMHACMLPVQSTEAYLLPPCCSQSTASLQTCSCGACLQLKAARSPTCCLHGQSCALSHALNHAPSRLLPPETHALRWCTRRPHARSRVAW
ncbi:hypothetical protein DUNSADRAFT_1076 [Dunaliella salina]|uniref:Uncharacterized protein n=1 Tax=Dunaliella salina TaxID=3046 RepID=A0ABQ7FY61_DUNSA|nr:hypothetical protein DUNSADRAFT_1076 [Dunaliella salina]|eukprot:KAF5827239.1 hypothetical protein DUNSADRAFT_1076 [Dunaliella salina]